MYNDLILRQPSSPDLKLSLREKILELSDGQHQTVLCENSTGYFDALATSDKKIYMVYSDMEKVYFGQYYDFCLHAQAMPVSPLARHFRLLHYRNKPILLYTLSQNGQTSIFLSYPSENAPTFRIASGIYSKTPYSVCMDSGQIYITYAMGDGGLYTNVYDCTKFTCIDTILHQKVPYGVLAPHTLYDHGVHVVYIAHDKKFGSVMYCPPGSPAYPVYKGCISDTLPLIYKEGGNIKIMWCQSNMIFSVDTTLFHLEEYKAASRSVVALRTNAMLVDDICSEMFAKIYSDNVFPFGCSMLFRGPLPNQTKIEDQTSRYIPQNMEIEKLKIRVKLLEDYISKHKDLHCAK